MPKTKHRIAFVDMLFSWPPNGGADTDLFHTIRGIQELGHEVHLFAAKNLESRERGSFEPDSLPFPSTRLDFRPREMNRRHMPGRFREAVRAWTPDAIFFGFGYFLKPYVAEALDEYPMAARLYAYELTCPRDLRLFDKEAPCPNNYLLTPDRCRECAVDGMAGDIKNRRQLAWPREYLTARAYMPGYYRRLLNFVRQCKTFVVYNEIQRRHLQGFHEDVRVIPGGVDFARLRDVPPPVDEPRRRKVILMTGRAEDSAKGWGTLLCAARELATKRDDFEVRVTLNEPNVNMPWLKTIGWQSQADLIEAYREADICVVPSQWEEPFGIVAAEAMAAGRPVCASRVGGLQDIVVDGETGFLFDRGDEQALARHLNTLLDDASLRERMGQAGRERAAREYDWAQIIPRYYPQLIEDLVS